MRPRKLIAQTFEQESLRYVSSTIEMEEDDFELNLPVELQPDSISSILDVGCGNGNMLLGLSKRFAARTAVGLEPSEDAVSLLREKHRGRALIFSAGSAEKLRFETESFDLVVCWSVLHWVGRENYLQALGELIRVTRKYLLILDFVAMTDYAVPYAHRKGYLTFKTDFEGPVLASGIMEKVSELRWFHDKEANAVVPISPDDLVPFRGNSLSYHSRKQVVFRKNKELLPVLSEIDFMAQ